MVQASHRRGGPGRIARSRLAVAAIAALVSLAAGCADSGQDGGGQDQAAPNITDEQTGDTDATAGQSTDGDQSQDGPVGSAADGETSDGATGPGSSNGDGGNDQPGQDPSVCTVDEVNVQPFYMVTNIPDDDPDGGLNLRTDYENGNPIDVLADGTVVVARDCIIAEDGGTWFAVETADREFGWANAAFLTSRIDPLLPTSGGQAAEDELVTFLDLLAARLWEQAADRLSVGDDGILIFDHQLERGATSGQDLPRLLEGYCQIRLCDAPYTVVEARGSYLPDLIPPEVDVRFDYPDGQTVETFRRIQVGDGRTFDTLPGQSNLAWTTSRPTATALAGADAADAPGGLLEAAELVRQALLSENGPAELLAYTPDEGIVFSPSSYVDPAPGAGIVVSPAELAEADRPSADDQLRIWGYEDGIGTAIVDSVPGWIGRYRRSSALLEPDEVAVDRRIGRSNTIANLAEVFPEASIVEFHRAGRGELSDFNWSSVRLAMEPRPQGWVVVAVVSDNWTI